MFVTSGILHFNKIFKSYKSTSEFQSKLVSRLGLFFFNLSIYRNNVKIKRKENEQYSKDDLHLNFKINAAYWRV